MNNLKNILENNKIKKFKKNENLKDLKEIYSLLWNKDNSPYEALTQLIDSYTFLFERPDLASLFAWQAINNMYNQLIIKDSTKTRLLDSIGITLVEKEITNKYHKYEPFLNPYFENVPFKVYKFVASYILKGYILEKNCINIKYISSSYFSFKKNTNFKEIYDIITKSFGEKLLKISKPIISDDKLSYKLNDVIDKKFKKEVRELVHGLALKLESLIKNGEVEITHYNSSLKTHIKFNFKQKLTFFLTAVLYASRCSNFHGNVASRLNSYYTKQDSYDTYSYISLLSYEILAILFHFNKYIDDSTLDALKKNENILKSILRNK